MKKYEGKMKEYGENIKKYDGSMKKYVENIMKKYEEMKKYEGNVKVMKRYEEITLPLPYMNRGTWNGFEGIPTNFRPLWDLEKFRAPSPK